jgi:hypothetical protein
MKQKAWRDKIQICLSRQWVSDRLRIYASTFFLSLSSSFDQVLSFPIGQAEKYDGREKLFRKTHPRVLSM